MLICSLAFQYGVRPWRAATTAWYGSGAALFFLEYSRLIGSVNHFLILFLQWTQNIGIKSKFSVQFPDHRILIKLSKSVRIKNLKEFDQIRLDFKFWARNKTQCLNPLNFSQLISSGHISEGWVQLSQRLCFYRVVLRLTSELRRDLALVAGFISILADLAWSQSG